MLKIKVNIDKVYGIILPLLRSIHRSSTNTTRKMIRRRLDTFLIWAIALVCVVCGAIWQINAASRQSIVIGGPNDRSYVSGFYDREVSLLDGSPFR
jgi:hypothetical protein